jgi:hypothetical protein
LAHERREVRCPEAGLDHPLEPGVRYALAPSGMEEVEQHAGPRLSGPVELLGLVTETEA